MISGLAHRNFSTKLFLLIAILLSAGCSFSRPTTTPIKHQYFNYAESNTTLVLLLPGFGDAPNNFVKHGTVEQIIDCRPDVIVLGIDAHFGYYKKNTIIDRLHHDIIRPAKIAGIKQIWLMGISMGGLGSLIYRQAHPDDIQAVILMAPYVGDWDDLTLYLRQPELARRTVSPKLIHLWDGLMASATDAPPITLASGENDSFKKQHLWLAGLIGNSHAITEPGKHRWKVWKNLWPRALQLSGLCSTEF
jgi:pimeloyl-ACP methyl ester carboxylesterase